MQKTAVLPVAPLGLASQFLHRLHLIFSNTAEIKKTGIISFFLQLPQLNCIMGL